MRSTKRLNKITLDDDDSLSEQIEEEALAVENEEERGEDGNEEGGGEEKKGEDEEGGGEDGKGEKGGKKEGRKSILFQREMQTLLKYLVKKVNNVLKIRQYKTTAREFIGDMGSRKTISCVNNRIKLLMKDVTANENLSIEMRGKLAYSFQVPIKREFLIRLRRTGAVDVNDKNCIINYDQSNSQVNTDEDDDVEEIPPVYDDDNERTGNDSRTSTREVDEDQNRLNHENSEAMIFENQSISSSLEVNQNSIHSISTTASFENNVSFHEQDSVFVESSNKKPKLEPFDGNLEGGVFGVLDDGEEYIEEIPDRENVDVKIDCHQFVQKLEMKELSTVVSAFHVLVKSLYIEEIGDFLETVELKMEQIGIEFVSIDTIKLAYEACINIVERCSSTEVKPHGSYNARDFFINVRHNLVSIRSDSLEVLIKKLTDDIENFQIVYQRVTIETLISALEVALTILTP